MPFIHYKPLLYYTCASVVGSLQLFITTLPEKIEILDDMHIL